MGKAQVGTLGVLLTGAGIAGLTGNWWYGCLFAGIVLLAVAFVWVIADV